MGKPASFMLTHIDIQNFVLVEKISLDFSRGLHVLTGETGAGKSIWVDAIILALGGRADSGVIRQGQSRCDISLSFDLNNIPAAQEWLQNHELEPTAECLIRRIVQSEGPSRSYINGIPCPLHWVKEFGELVLNIHGQHQQQDLLKSDGQQQQLDRFGKHEPQLQKIRQLYQQWRVQSTRYAEIQNTLAHRQSELDFLRYQLSELQQLNLQAGEWQMLTETHKQLAHSEQWRQQLEQVSLLLSDEDHSSALNQAYRALHLLQSIKIESPQLMSSQQLLKEALINLQEAGNEIINFTENLLKDPEKLQEMEQRLGLIHQVARKHRMAPESLLQVEEDLKNKISSLENVEEELKNLAVRQAQIIREYEKIAADLTASREKAAQILNTQITAWMQELGMKGGRFQINFDKISGQIHPSGNERIHFQVSTNPGQDFQTLSKIASGGELSRLHLALQVITAEKEQTPTLIFDEVDTGIGGQTAAIVGKLLRQLAEKTQVLCITHLPQVAAHGQHHYKVSKKIKEKTTLSQIELLAHSERIQELARMLGGEIITGQSLSHAEEMLSVLN